MSLRGLRCHLTPISRCLGGPSSEKARQQYWRFCQWSDRLLERAMSPVSCAAISHVESRFSMPESRRPKAAARQDLLASRRAYSGRDWLWLSPRVSGCGRTQPVTCLESPHGHLAGPELDLIGSVVPSVAGIYAWYIGFDRDMDASLRDESSFRILLSEYRRHLEAADLQVSVRDTAFPMNWRAVARSEPARPRSFMEQAIVGPENIRQEVWKALQAWRTSPIFAAPLYIGKSYDLRQRLITHANTLRLNERRSRAETSDSDAYSEDRESEDSDEAIARHFADRCLRQGIGMGRLELFFCAATALDEPVRNTVVDVVEETLNTWYRPRLGRR